MDSTSKDIRRALTAQVAAEQLNACSVPRGGGWRPGARWARAEVQAAIATLPAHQQPPMRELGRRSEAAPHPFKAMRPDEGARSSPGRGGGPPRSGGGGGAPQATPSRPAPSTTLRAVPLPASVEDHPPLVLVHKTGPRVEIAAACTHARALGITRGMALTQARAQTPGLDVRDYDPEGDAADLAALAIVLARRVSPTVAIDGRAGLLIDITGTEHLHGGEAAMARRIVRQLARRGFTARIAVAHSATAAHALARYGPARIVHSHDDAAALAPLPVAALALAEPQVELLRRLGIDTIGMLADVARGPLARRFGPGTVTRLDQALGRLPDPLTPVVPPEPIAITQRFAEPIATAEAIEHWLGTLVPRLTAELATAGLGARRIEVIADRIDAVPQHIRIGLARPSRDGGHILRLLVRRIGDVEPGYGIDALTLYLRAADRLGAEALGAELTGEAEPDLAPLVDTLATLGRRLWRVRPVESDVPERSAAPAPPLDPPTRAAPRLKPDDVRTLDTRTVVPPWHPRWPRPVRLLARPERIDNVLSVMPDGAPRRFVWRGRTVTVARSDGPERIAGE
ncbi:MAG: DNA polymerase Y family protein, partial [Sphingomonadales bacterium]|nr:DNA polymerase Y family protein [Sphingomonadales bacterium]